MEIKINGMSCKHCAAKVENALKDLGLKKVKVDLESNQASFKENHKVTEAMIKEAVQSAGYEVA